MRERPDYPDEWADPDHPQAEFWKTDPAYWQHELDYWTVQYRDVEAKRYAWLDVWFKTRNGDMMGEVDYLKLRVSGELAHRMALGAMLRLHQLGHPETVSLS